MSQFDDLLTGVRYLKNIRKENLESICRKTPEELKLDLEVNALITADDDLLGSIINVFKIFEREH